jgi:cytoskeleton protein RodZ
MEPAEAIESPGKYLRAKREFQRLSLEEVADTTRIRKAVLVAIEEDRTGELPFIYIKSFLSAYAKCLGLDPSDVIMLHQKYLEKRSLSKSQEVKLSFDTRRRRINVRWLIISIFGALLIALIVYASFKLLE